MDQADPLPRLGLGLALIRNGNLTDGREQIEIAAGLDSGNALVRSYLGKAFYEEKNSHMAGRQYGVAKELDPNDPTPYFYDAIRKQTENRPVAAFFDLQESIEKNDNRAVYRSKLLLDEDLAARSASLGRIYGDLGFEQLALVEGWKSVNTDAANHSAHRLLADVYAKLPRHEEARLSELFQSQLLQPVQINPLHPQLNQSNLSVLEGTGASSTTFNEFNPLFNRNRLSLQASGITGSNNTRGDEITQSGVWGRWSYSLGQYHYETEGFRENNDQEQDFYNAFAKIGLTPDTSLQAEYRHTDNERGDLELTFTDDFDPNQRQTDEIDTLRLGLHHRFRPGSELIAAFTSQNIESDTSIPGRFDVGLDQDIALGEIRHLFRSKRFQLDTGGGYRRVDESITSTFSPPTDENFHVSNAYVYARFDPFKQLNVTLGASAVELEGAYDSFGTKDFEQFNPKFGLIWTPFSGTTLRGAAFRTITKVVGSRKDINPTLEPTQVAGFNQFFSGPIGEDTWRYGLAADQQIFTHLFAGVEWTARNLNVPLVQADPSGFSVQIEDFEEKQGRGYLYWTPSDRLVLNGEYLYERFDREDETGRLTGPQQFTKLRTHRIPLSIRYFHPLGMSATFTATHIKQDGRFVTFGPTGPAVEPGDDRFWVLDTSFSYRLPKRYGIITLEAKNLLDKSFSFQDTDPENPRVLPDRQVILKLTCAF